MPSRVESGRAAQISLWEALNSLGLLRKLEMYIQLVFDKTVQVSIGEYVWRRGQKKHPRLKNKKKLDCHDANQLIQGLLSAMLIKASDDKEEGETEITPEIEEEADTQALTQTQDVRHNSKFHTSTQGTQDGTRNNKTDFSNLFKFYRNWGYKFRAKCQFEHPKFCKKFFLCWHTY